MTQAIFLTMPMLFTLAQLPAPRGAEVDYVHEIKPLLAARCYACHGGLQQKGGLRVDTAKSLRAGGNHGPALVPGQSGDSLMIAHVTASKGKRRMPLPSEGEPLSVQQVELLRVWIDRGAKAPDDEQPEPDPREHWAFRPPVRPAVPQVQDAARVRNPIDAFLEAERAKRSLIAQPPADKRLLLRRVYLDLIGLPPTRDEQEVFLADPSADAYEKVVERLLQSPQYGERWARHWMDVWRYSDWWGLGAEVRNSQKHIWHWRDWIVESLNVDRGYDQMVREMLAADELYPNDLDCLRATGYLARQYFLFNRNSWLEETIEHTAKAFLGLTMNCARCHDHKYDPISSNDYYRFRAFFEPYQLRLEQVPGEPDFARDGIPRAFDCNLDAPTYKFVRGDEKQPIKDHPLPPGLPPLLTGADLEISPLTLPLEGHMPGLRPYVFADHLQLADAKVKAARETLAKAKADLAAVATASAGATAAMVLAEKGLAAAVAQVPALKARAAADRAKYQTPTATNVQELAQAAAQAEKAAAYAAAEDALARAELEVLQAALAQKAAAEKKRDTARAAVEAARKALDNPGDVYTPLPGALKTPESNLESLASRTKPFPTTSTGRRSALARWMTDPKNPLTARVAVNHIWARHFGKPLVPTVFDFGRKGTPPTHPALLDWLAVEFMAGASPGRLPGEGWSMKHLHRLIVTSAAYRLASSDAGADANRTADQENRWYWRRDSVRMEAQVVRDSLLYLAGELDSKLGGLSVPVSDESSRRRSLYFVHSHNEHNRFLSLFDDASVLECYRRAESIVPAQALALSNSRLALTLAGKINDWLHAQLGTVSDAAFVRAAFETVLAASPTPQEQQVCEQGLAQLRAVLTGQPDAKRQARGILIQALVNHNDFLTIR
jgi:multidrug efflux pump subunit AcrA (membrane-fusion protein)